MMLVYLLRFVSAKADDKDYKAIVPLTLANNRHDERGF